jgi:hypothetical protein
MVAFTGVASFLVPDLEKLLSVIGALAGSNRTERSILHVE